MWSVLLTNRDCFFCNFVSCINKTELNMLTSEDLNQLKSIGFTLQQIEEQLSRFKTGFPFVKLLKPVVLNDGIKYITTKGEVKLNEDFDEYVKDLIVTKFVPASGAATRMFKDLFDFKENYDSENLSPKVAEFGRVFFNGIKKFAFYSDLEIIMENDGFKIADELSSKNYKIVLNYLLTEIGLNYGNLPKALLKFHRNSNQSYTAIDEHLIEGALYGVSSDGKVRVHFTLSPEHVSLFEAHVSSVKAVFEKRYNVKYEITHSIQQPTTDTIAVNLDNTPFRTTEGKLLFRPAGHGALIWNVNQLKSDIIFIKNIDNVVPERKNESTILYKKIIGALLIQNKKTIDKWLKLLIGGGKVNLDEVVSFVKNDLAIEMIPSFKEMNDNEKKEHLIFLLNRPIRVCGMVKNEGEPGGGPFWLPSEIGASLQIVESSQIDLENEGQKKIVELSTHFNPVDIVCSINDYQGNVFDLSQFVDKNTGFISYKSKDGKDLKALELPGLWNGAMAKWTTIFVEVPIGSFNPVKTVNDLLRKEHQ